MSYIIALNLLQSNSTLSLKFKTITISYTKLKVGFVSDSGVIKG